MCRFSREGRRTAGGEHPPDIWRRLDPLVRQPGQRVRELDLVAVLALQRLAGASCREWSTGGAEGRAGSRFEFCQRCQKCHAHGDPDFQMDPS